MKARLLFLLRSFIFWVGLFVFSKIAFLIYQAPLSIQASPALWIASIWHGLIMDVAMTAYVMMVLALVTALTFFFSGRILKPILRSFNTLILVAFLFVIVVDLEIYRNWGFHVDTSPFEYLKNPQEAAASTPLHIYILTIALYAGLLTLAIKLYNKKVLAPLTECRPMKFYWSPLFIIIGGAMIIPARGGFDVQPMNTSFVYFSSNIYANHVAVNPVWNFLYALDHMDNYDKDYNCATNEETQELIGQLMSDNGIAPKVLNTEKPNVIFIVLESFSSTLLDFPEVIPNLSAYINEGLFFNHYYSVAERSAKGLAGTMLGFPANPGDAVFKYPNKVEKMPNLGLAFSQMGYNTSFCYGGNVTFGNLNSYLSISGFDRVTDKSDFPSELYGSKWGVHDGPTFERFYENVAKQDTPFFSILYTLSSHEPYDVPEKVIEGTSKKMKFLNSAKYTDRHLGLFMDEFRESPLWDNTLIIITADHGSSFIHKELVHERSKYRMPMLWMGGAIDTTGVVSKYGAQTDLCATLLNQFDYPTDDFIYSKDLLSPDSKGFSYYAYPGGVTFLNDSAYHVYNLKAEQYIVNEGSEDWKMAGRMILQHSFNYFLDK